MDAVLVAIVVVDKCKKEKEGLVLKVDLKKAYNMSTGIFLRQNFIRKVVGKTDRLDLELHI